MNLRAHSRRDKGRIEDALRESQERYERVVQATNSGLWDWDVVNDTYYVSPRFLEMNGFPPDTVFAGREDFVRRNPMHEEDVPKYKQYEQAVRDLFAGTGSRLAAEVRVLLNGEVRWRRLEGICFRDETGAVVRWTGSTTDITDRKRAELALVASEERYALAMEAAGDGHTDWDFQTGEHYVSPRLLEICGHAPNTVFVDRAEWVRRFPFHPEDRPRWEQAVAAHFAAHKSHFKMELRIVVRGEVRWTAFHFLSTRDAAGTPIRWTGSIGDITEQKRTEEARRQSEERYSLAMEASEEGYFDIDLETDALVTSERFNEIHGFPAGTRFGTRSAFLKELRFYANDAEIFYAAAKATLLKDSPERYQFEYRILTSTGEMRWVRMRGKVTHDAEGRARRRTGMVADITARKLAEESLRLSEERYARALEVAEEGHWDWNVRTDQFFASPQTLKVYGVPEDAKYTTRTEALAIARLHPEDEARVSQEWTAALDGQGAKHEFEYRILVHGEHRWVRTGWRIFRDDAGVASRVIGVVVDITARKHAQEALRQSEERYSLVVAGSNEGIYDWDLVSDRVYVSYRAQELFRLPRGELWRPRRDWRHIVAFHPDDEPRLHDSVKAHIEGGVSTYDVEFRIAMPDGEVRWFRQRGIALRDASSKAYRVVGSIGDITERKQAEEAMRKMEQELRRAQRLESIGTLAGGIAHDFNNILGAILGYGEMAMRDATKGTRLRRDLDSIMAAGERGRALVDQVLAFSRSGIGERVPVHVQAVVREALGQVAASLPTNVVIARRLRAGRAAMLGDSTQVHQVVMNLASNAAQAMVKGGVLRVTLDTARIDEARSTTVGSIEPGAYIVLRVTDTGDGIPEDVLDRIFDPFFTTKEVGTGSGLGLSLVHGIVTNVDGAIDVVTELRKGTTFTVYLRRSGDAPDKPADEDRPLPRGTGERVLVVDDEAPLVRLVTETLERLGYAPVGFTSSVAALAAFRADPERFDAVLTDERMPGLSGSALIRELRGIRDSIPVVLMSGYLAMENVDADVVVRKPLSAGDLAVSLSRVLNA